MGISYSPFGGMNQEQFGTTTTIYNKALYNVRVQLGEIRVGRSPMIRLGNWARSSTTTAALSF
jgi:hypothetical protein